MAKSLKSFDRDISFTDVVDDLSHDGAVIIRNFLTKTQLTNITTVIDKELPRRKAGLQRGTDFEKEFYGVQTVRFCGLADKSDTFVELLIDPFITAYVDHALLPLCDSYCLSQGEVMYVCPGQRQQMLHRDDDIWPFSRYEHRVFMANINGRTRRFYSA